MASNEGMITMPGNTTAVPTANGNSINTVGTQQTQVYGEPDTAQGNRFCRTCQQWHAPTNGSYGPTEDSPWECYTCSGTNPIMIQEKQTDSKVYLPWCLLACCILAACLGGVIAAIVLSTGQKKSSSNSSASSSSSSSFRSDGSNYTNSRYTGTGSRTHAGGVAGTRTRSGGTYGRSGGRSGGRGGSSGGSSGGSCFVAGTRIALGDGQSYVDIEHVKLNDPLAWDLRVTGVHSFRHFLKDDELCVFQLFQDFVLVTADHMMFENGKWIYAEDSKHTRCLKMNEAKGVLKKMNVPIHGGGEEKEWIVVYNLDTDEHILPIHYDFFHSNMTHARALSLPLFSDFVLLDENSSPQAFDEIAKVEEKDLSRRVKQWL